MSFNKIILVGNLGRDPELRYTSQGIPVCTFSVATTERRGRGGEGGPGGGEVTTWFRVTLWRGQAEVASKYLKKGSQVYIEGRLRIEEYQDRNGANRTSLEVTGTEIQFIGTRGGGDMPESREPRSAAPAGGEEFQDNPISDDDIPF